MDSIFRKCLYILYSSPLPFHYKNDPVVFPLSINQIKNDVKHYNSKVTELENYGNYSSVQ